MAQDRARKSENRHYVYDKDEPGSIHLELGNYLGNDWDRREGILSAVAEGIGEGAQAETPTRAE